MDDLLQPDLVQVDDAAESDLSPLVDSHLFITGATGFVGTWLVNSWLFSHRQRSGKGSLTLLARSFPDELKRLAKDMPKTLRLHQSDVRDLEQDSLNQVEYLIHAATPARESLNLNSPSEMISIIVDGQRAILNACNHKSLRGILFLSSGAVYGRQPRDNEFLVESYPGAPSTTESRNAYHESKRFAELLGSVWADTSDSRFVIARLFAFLGPHLPMDQHFAAGNFIGSVLQGVPPSLSSQGTSIRSYQYPSDMTAWLWALLSRGRSKEAYNVGSMEAISIRQLAERVLSLSNIGSQTLTYDPSSPDDFSRYVPSTSKIQDELKVKNRISLDDAITRTITWGLSRRKLI